MVTNFHGDSTFFNDLHGKVASFLLGVSVTRTLEIKGITQAGIPGKIHLTPTIDAEFITDRAVPSLGEIAETPGGAPTPALAVRAVHDVVPFSEIVTLDLGLVVKPQLTDGTLINFEIEPSGRIDKDCDLPAREIFKKGQQFGLEFTPRGSYTILAESTPSGTTTARTTAQVLGYNAQGCFSSSFGTKPVSIKEETVQKALNRINKSDSTWDKLSKVSDNMLVFTAGFVSTATAQGKVVLGGGTQMSSALLILDKLQQEKPTLLSHFIPENVALLTTSYVFDDPNSDIQAIFSQMKISVSGFYTPFTFATASLPPLKLYDTGEAKEGVGMGAALGYASLHDISIEQIVLETEKYLK